MTELTPAARRTFNQQLLDWAARTPRPLPWKGADDPYFIWLSEIILQQTRVEQGLPYYHRFVERFPNITALADAHEDEVMKCWEGLGYYSRARNLHATAKYIAYELDGVFPTDYESILALKGVGPYTAAAIASFAYNLPHAVVDGNVFRVLSRVFGRSIPIDSSAGKKEFQRLADELLPKKKAAIYNQAIMDFGATQCKPKQPGCIHCPLQSSCWAYANDAIALLPVKSKKIVKRRRYFNYLVLNHEGQTLIERREEKDIWKHLYQFPLIESSSPASATQLQQQPLWQQLLQEDNILSIKPSKDFQQTLSHQYIQARFWKIELDQLPDATATSFHVVHRKKLSDYAFPKIIDLYLQDNSLYLELF